MARIISVDMVKQVVRKKERNEYLLRTYSMPSIAIGTLFFLNTSVSSSLLCYATAITPPHKERIENRETFLKVTCR